MPTIDKIKREPEVGKEGQIADVLKVGDPILVQVTKEPINTKGPRLTGEISIAGRNMVLIPFADGVMVSQKIKREAERSRLKQLLLSIKPQGFGIIIRTVAEDKRAAELDNELRLLLQRWEEAVKSLQKKEPVSLVCEEIGRTIGIIRDVLSPDFTSIQINDQAVYDEVRQYLELIAPESAKIVKLYQGTQPIFDKFDITRQMKTGLGRVVGFKHGGYLIIDKTEALFSIDVNSGSKKIFEDQEENAYQFNMLAADELAHQLRLRDIGGIIIVDFIDMDSKEHQQQLYDHMRKLMERDRARHNVLPLSKFGLMQITRQRVRPAVEMEVMEVCTTCMGKGKVQPTLLFTDQVQEDIEHMSEHFGKGLRLHLHPFIYAYATRGLFTSLASKWKRKYGVKVIENQSLGMLETRFFDKQGKQLQMPKEEKNESVKEPRKETAPEPKKETAPEPKKESAPEPKKETVNEPKKEKSANAPTEAKQPVSEPQKPKKKAKPEQKKATPEQEAKTEQQATPEQKAKPEQKKAAPKRSKQPKQPNPQTEKSNNEENLTE